MNKTNDYAIRILSKQKIFLNPDELNSGMEKTIERRLRESEGFCNNLGYILKNSINMIDRKSGIIPNSEMVGGKVVFEITYQMAVISPKPQNIIPCQITEKNSIAITAKWGFDNVYPLILYMMKQNHSDNTLYDSIQVDDFVEVVVLSSRCKLKSSVIMVTGEVVKKINAADYINHIDDLKSSLLLHE